MVEANLQATKVARVFTRRSPRMPSISKHPATPQLVLQRCMRKVSENLRIVSNHEISRLAKFVALDV